ncbi:MAG: alpha/beta hydrolase [Candidatus Helarchaeota archaeon]
MSLKEFFLSNKKRTGVFISAIILFAGFIPLVIFTYFADPAHPYTITQTTLVTEDFVKLKAHVYTPRNMTGDHPGIVIAHGFTGNSRHMQTLAIELVKREFVVVSLNFRGHGNSGGFLPSLGDPLLTVTLVRDMRAGIDYLKEDMNCTYIGLVGHSMGAMTAMKASDIYSNEINATVIMGMAGGFEGGLRAIMSPDVPADVYSVNFSRITNLLIANGRLEEMFTPAVTLAFLEEYNNQTGLEIGVQYGNFTFGNASKAVLGAGEHLFEPLDRNIVYETVLWFELAFYGNPRWNIKLTTIYNELYFVLAMSGMIALCFVAVLYLHNYLWKRRPRNLSKDLVETSLLKLFLGYFGAVVLGAGFLIIGLFTFGEVLPISMGELLYGIAVGSAVGAILMYYLFVIRRSEKSEFWEIPRRIKQMCLTPTYKRSIIYGILTAALFPSAIAVIANWSTIITVPTLRELGAIFGMAILFFPWLLIKEFYFRTVQSKLNSANRFKEYFSMVGLGFLMDSTLIIGLMFLTWGNGSLIGFAALALFVVVLFSIIQQILVTWIYMYSGRNILGSAIFLSIFYAWMMINFYPFGASLI